ncbi:MAG: hypothetical protein ACLTVV_06050 [Ruminococcus sp.]
MKGQSNNVLWERKNSKPFKIRNGVETLPSLLRRRYHADRMSVRGLIRGRFFFGCKIGALNFKKLFTYRKGLGHYAQNPVLA